MFKLRLLGLCLFLLPGVMRASDFNVHNYGAIGDGKTKDTLAIQKAIDAATSAGGGKVVFPAGTYLCGSIELKTGVDLDLDHAATIQGSSDVADYPIITLRWEGLEVPCHEALIYAHDARNIAVTGSGSIFGSGNVGKLRVPRGSTLIEFISCANIHITGVTVANDGNWTIHPTYCENVTISNVTINSVGHNSDGIDPDSCTHVAIEGCIISAGDDDIAIKSGKGREGVKIGKPTSDLSVTKCTFLKGHGGVSIGSELSGGISNISISDCSFQGVKEAIYIKTCPGRAGFVHHVQANRLTVTDAPLFIIRTNYNSNADSQGVPGKEGLTQISDISISDVAVTSNKGVVTVDALPDSPVSGLVLSNIHGSSKRGIVLANINNVDLKDIKITGLSTPLLSTVNAHGSGLEGAALYTPDGKK